MKRLHLFAAVLVVFACTSIPALAGGTAAFPDGTVLQQSGAAFLCLPGQPDNAQDQTSGIFEVSGVLYSVGDDSGQLFRFGIDAPYMDYCDALRVPRWRPDLDLEELTYLPAIDEFAISFESRDTKVQFVRIQDDALVLDEELYLELPPGYQHGTNIGPEGLAFDSETSILMVGWEGNPVHRGASCYLSFYRVNCGAGEVTSVDFLRHVRMPARILTCCGLYFDPCLRALLVVDRNQDALFIFPNFDPLTATLATPPQYGWEPAIELSFAGVTDGFGREYAYHSFEGVAVNDDGTLGLVTDPWRSPDYSTYRPVDESQLDEYYRKFVPQLIWFEGFREELARQLMPDGE
ncbi:MAG: hypothetical protein A2Y63_02405 [Candidatus Riflebacteria bacterium RBG_13_59_9]|nr:MAG: hypothetical protein A2Y63_02405 [Candidatus Riflebacteria bacterium RBG_13_59_9]